MKANETLPPKARLLMKGAPVGFLGAVVLDLILMAFLDFWTAFYIALGRQSQSAAALGMAAQHVSEAFRKQHPGTTLPFSARHSHR